MRLLIDRGPLVDALEVARRIASSDGTDLGATLTTTGPKSALLTLRNDRLIFRSSLECTVTDPGAFCLSARKLFDRVKALPSKSTVEVVSDTAFVRIGHHEHPRVFGMLARPVLVEPQDAYEERAWTVIDPEAAVAWIKACSFAAGDEAQDARTHIGELKILSRETRGRIESGLRLCTTDGYRVASHVLPLDVPVEWPERVGLSVSSIDLMAAMLDGEAIARMAVSDRAVVLEASRGQLEMRTTDCVTPYDRFFELAGKDYALRLPMTPLETALAGLKLATDEGGGVEWHVEDNAIVRLVVHDKKGNVAAEEEVSGTWESDPCPMVAKLRGVFILEAIQAQRTDTTEDVFLRYTHPMQPFVIDIGGDAQCVFAGMRME